MKNHLKSHLKWLSWGLSSLLVWQCMVPPGAAQQTPPAPGTLNIVVLDGEGAINNVRQKAVREPVVRVEDDNHRPVTGAAVAFILPTDGPSGEFSGSKTLSVVTDNQGQAAAHGLRANPIEGKLLIHVNASYRGLTARTVITQFNMQVPGAKGRGGGGSGKMLLILGLLGGAAAGGLVAATHKGSTSSSSPTSTTPGSTAIVITPGTTTVGSPH
jgi:hypothetical protein